MSEQRPPSPPVADWRQQWRDQWAESPYMWWLAVSAIGVPVLWWSLGVSFVLGTWTAGHHLGWPGAMDCLRAAWGLAQGQRLDEAWLFARNDITAIATSWWLTVFAALAVLVPVSWVIVVAQWRAAGWPMPDIPAGLFEGRKNPNRPQRDFICRKWPIPAPYDHRRPGPGVLLGRHGRRHLVATDGLPVLVVGSTGSGKTRRFLGPNAAHYPGPVVATSVKQDLAELSLAHRKAKGKVYGFEPTGRLHNWMVQHGITPVAWDPVRFMASDPTRENADMLSQFLAGQSSAAGQGSQSVWSNLVQAAMSDMLLIAAEVDASLSDVLKWMTKLSVFAEMAKSQKVRRRLSPEALEALDQLASDAEKDSRIAGSIEATAHELTRSLKWTATKGDQLEAVPVNVTVNGGSDTLFLIADHSSQSTHEALFGAVLRHLFHVAETAVLNPDVSHTRPLFALDEFANLARLADMPKLISTIRSRAQVIIGVQTPAQLAASWGKDNATTIMDNCAVKVLLPGSSDSAALQTFVTLTNDDDDDNAEMATAANWRMIEDGHAMALAGNRKPFCFKLCDDTRWLDNPQNGTDNTAEAENADGPDGTNEGAENSRGGVDADGSWQPANSSAPDGGQDEFDPAGTNDFELDSPASAEPLFDLPVEVPPYELLYETADTDWAAGNGLPFEMDSELDEAHKQIKARLARTIPLSANETPPETNETFTATSRDHQPQAAFETSSDEGDASADGLERWAPPPVLQAGNPLGITTEGIEGRERAPAQEMLTFADADGGFGLHPAGCVVDLGPAQPEK